MVLDFRTAEAEQIQRLLEGDQSSWWEIYREHSPEVFRLARRFVHSDAEGEEVVQEVFLSIFQSLRRFRGQSRLKTWIYRITVNRALKRRRWWSRRREQGAEILEWKASLQPSPDSLAGERMRLERVRALLNQLDERKRTVLILHELEGMDTKEIAKILDCPRSTVLTRLSRARAELTRRAQKLGLLEELR